MKVGDEVWVTHLDTGGYGRVRALAGGCCEDEVGAKVCPSGTDIAVELYEPIAAGHRTSRFWIFTGGRVKVLNLSPYFDVKEVFE